MESYGALWNPYGALWNLMEPYGALWSLMEPYGALWSLRTYEVQASFNEHRQNKALDSIIYQAS